VGIVAVRRQNDESAHAGLLPRRQQVVHPTVQRLAAHSGIAGVATLRGRVDAVLDRRRAHDAECGGEVVREPLDDDRVAPEWEVGPVLFAGAHGHQET
jgi:hypothetical protein